MKNIVFISHIMPPAVDGGSSLIYKLAENWRHQAKICLVCSNAWSSDDFVNPKSKPIGKTEDKLRIIRLPVYKNLRLIFKALGLPIWSKGPVFKFIPFIRLLRELNNQGVDWVVAGPLPTSIAWYAGLIKKIFRAKLLLIPCFHQTDKDFFDKQLLDCLIKADKVAALTVHEKNFYQRKLGIKLQKVVVIGGGVDENFLINEKKVSFPKKNNLLFLGNFAAHKRVELLIEAWQALRQEGFEISLTLAGRKTLYSPNIINKIKKLDMKSKKELVLIDGGYDDIQKKKLIDKCSLLVLPSNQESFGIVLAEAWARGKPVVGANILPILEIVGKSKGGWVFDKENLASLIEVLKLALNSPEERRDRGLKGLVTVRDCYTWKRIASDLWPKLN